MGWLIIFAADEMSARLSDGAITWLAAGGVTYTLGTVFYAIKRIPFNHAIWHMFVLGGLRVPLYLSVRIRASGAELKGHYQLSCIGICFHDLVQLPYLAIGQLCVYQRANFTTLDFYRQTHAKKP